MVRIEVVAFDGKPPTLELAAEFDELGGTIGRDASCTLVLPDPEKRISRRHGVLVLREGRFVLRDEGSAIAIRHNGRAVGAGREVVLSPGDQIDIGAYALRVSFPPSKQPIAATSSRTDARPAAGGNAIADLGDDRARKDPFADPAPRAARGAQQRVRAPAATPPGETGSSNAVIPPDFDPFAAPAEPAPAPASVPGPGDPLGLGLRVPEQSESVDVLFGLRAGEPFPPGHPLAPEADATNAPSVDELLALRRSSPSAQPVQRDDVAELHGAMKLPEQAAHRPPGAPEGLVVSWERESRDGRASEVKSVVIPPTAARASALLEPGESSPAGEPMPMESAQERLNRGGDAEAGAPRHPLLAAFLDGAGVPTVPLRELTPELMRALGVLLRTATQGTLDLLRARAAVKGELHAALTVIAPVENNPLKFSPTVEAALYHLLAPQGRGFMAPPRALQEAYRDLVSHQMGFAAGMRAALAATLARFDPQELEKRLADKSILDELVPALRRARLWDLYMQRFGEVAGEAESSFNRIFEREFVKAYEAQVARLAKSEGSEER